MWTERQNDAHEDVCAESEIDGVGAAEFVGNGAEKDSAQHDAHPHDALGRRHQGTGGADEVPLATGAAVDD